MITIAVCEGNTEELVRRGLAGARGFEVTLPRIEPTVQLRIVSPYSGDQLKPHLEEVDGIAFTGSATAWSASEPQAGAQLKAMEVALESGLPVWGSCNGLHLGTVVLGGAVEANPKGIEAGLAKDLRPTGTERNHPMIADRRKPFCAPTIHRDHVSTLPHGATVVVSNDHSPVQAMVFERQGIDFWATQYHPELTLLDIANFARHADIFDDLQPLASPLKQATNREPTAGDLGTAGDDMVPAIRESELRAWLAHVQTKADSTVSV